MGRWGAGEIRWTGLVEHCGGCACVRVCAYYGICVCVCVCLCGSWLRWGDAAAAMQCLRNSAEALGNKHNEIQCPAAASWHPTATCSRQRRAGEASPRRDLFARNGRPAGPLALRQQLARDHCANQQPSFAVQLAAKRPKKAW